MNKKKTFTVLGNCQTVAITDYLLSSRDFTKEYELIRIPPVHTLTKDMQKQYFDEIKNVDLILTQPITDKTRFPFLNNDVIKNIENKNIITFPSAYYSGYFPTYESVDFASGSMNNVHDYLVIQSFLEKKTVEETLYLKENLKNLPDDFLLNQHINSIASLHRRELNSDTDIFLSCFIIKNFQKQKLFHTFNHPADITLNYLSNEILNRLGKNKVSFLQKNNSESLGHIKLQINRRVKKILKLKFTEDKINVNNLPITNKDHIESDFKIYSSLKVDDLSMILRKKKAFLISS